MKTRHPAQWRFADRLSASSAARCAPRGVDERGSLPMLMLVMLMGVLLSGLMIPVVVNQGRSTSFAGSRVRTLQAAQAGLDAMIGRIRNAVDANDVGTSAQLPCDTFTGTVSGNSAATYSVSVQYFINDPVPTPGTPMRCVQGFGTYDIATTLYTPSYALITSKGIDSTGGALGSQGRTLTSTYVFKTSNVNIAGGVIRIFPASTAQYCMDAGSTTPLAGTAVTLQVCSTTTPPIAQQVWVYRTDLTIQLTSSVTTTYPNGLCIDTSSSTAGNNMILQPCKPLGSATYDQLWSSDDSAHLRGSKSDKSDTSTLCIHAASQTPGQVLTLQTCAGGVTDVMQTWVPSANAGAGQAGASNKQLVNFLQFGRCLDVTNNTTAYANGSTPGGGQFIILYTCKQNPNPTNVGKNQQWVSSPALNAAPTTSRWITQLDTTYCLSSPKTIGGYVTVQKCTTGTLSSTDAQAFTSYQELDANGHTLDYSSKYTIQDSAGLCLSLSPNSDTYNGQYYKAIVDKCNGSTAQKWNANPNLGVSQTRNTIEK